ncbi:hypothetical protein SAMN05421823_112198 [Catalinimonas alkaloidigena]|uniref:Uncharacterized protein n=1 Tax=Catalinimonas alkaloidigena TaxID=1075417 RepID=A0A1G9SL82_9BACT|nr:hypothetical protein [Catalinimonas alkaloidigena]SDM36057.1 hypothetical protein SAMN05421823_112198 [Catalinimonas alkaloidigena]
MELSKIATEWAKAEVFSSRFFILFAMLFLAASVGFWQLGKTETAKAYIFPALIAGILLLAIGLGIFFTNKSRVASFAPAYTSDPVSFVNSEITRTEKSIGEYRTIVFKVIPLIIVVASLLIVFLDTPRWRAISITTISLMVVILWVDSNANARIEAYQKQLKTAKASGIDSSAE